MINLNEIYIRSFLKDLFHLIDINEKSTVLDLGCGIQPYNELLQNMFDFVISADKEKRYDDLDCYADAHNAPFATHSFDVLIMSEVLEHLSDPKSAIAEAARILKPGGYLILTWPFLYSIHEIPFDFCRFTEFGIYELLGKNNLNVLRIQRRGDVFAVLHTIISQLLLGSIELLKRIPWVGYIFRPLFWFLKACIEMSLKANYFLFRKSKRLNPEVAGGNLKGPIGSLALWTLGYCVIAQKYTH